MIRQLHMGFQGCVNVSICSWTTVQPMGDGIQFALQVNPQLLTFRQVLTQKAMGVLVRAVLSCKPYHTMGHHKIWTMPYAKGIIRLMH